MSCSRAWPPGGQAAPHRATRCNTGSKKIQSFQPPPRVQVPPFASHCAPTCGSAAPSPRKHSRRWRPAPDWGSTVLIVTCDEWGGFFDHVAPPRAVAPNDVEPRSGRRQGVARDARADRGHVAVHPRRPGQSTHSLHRPRPYLDPEAHRVALEPATAHAARRVIKCRQSGTALDFAAPDAVVPALPQWMAQ